jgi:hypothetical protein
MEHDGSEAAHTPPPSSPSIHNSAKTPLECPLFPIALSASKDKHAALSPFSQRTPTSPTPSPTAISSSLMWLLKGPASSLQLIRKPLVRFSAGRVPRRPLRFNWTPKAREGKRDHPGFPSGWGIIGSINQLLSKRQLRTLREVKTLFNRGGGEGVMMCSQVVVVLLPTQQYGVLLLTDRNR